MLLRISRVFIFGLLACPLAVACNSSPSSSAVANSLAGRFAASGIDVQDVARVNGMPRPGGNGEPDRYSVRFTAALVPTADVTIHFASGIDAAAANGALIKDIVRGLVPDPVGWSAFLSIGTANFRARAGDRVPIVGEVLFDRTENGWQAENVSAFLPDATVRHATEQIAANATTREVNAMKSDLRNLVTAQEAYFSDHHRYGLAIGSGDLVYAPSQGVSVEMGAVTDHSWVATAHRVDTPALECRISVGLDSAQYNDGEPTCNRK